MSAIDSYFGLTRRGSTVSREVRGGLVTFFAMAYIIALNPLIIGTTADAEGNLISGLPYADAAGHPIGANVATSIAMVAAATALVAAVMTGLMGLVGRYPLAIAAGLGLNALLANVIAPQITWPQAMGLVVWEGILIALFVLTGVRTAIFRAVPRSLRAAIAVGIGLFITLVGLVDSGIVTRPAAGVVPVQLGSGGQLATWPVVVFVLGLLLVVVLNALRVRGALLLTIIVSTVVALVLEAVLHLGSVVQHPGGWALNVPAPTGVVAVPDLGLLGRVDLIGAFTKLPFLAAVMIVFTLLLADFFDTMGTVVAVGAEGGLLQEDGTPEGVDRILMVDSLAAVAGGVGSVSSNTGFIESAAGVGEGARTGLASVVTALGFVVAMFFAPLVNLVPSEAVTPVLVFVGFLMMGQIREIDFSDIEEGLPAFLGIVLMPFTYSITVGIGAAAISFVLLKAVRGHARAVHPLLWAVAALFVVYFLQAPIGRLIA